MAEADRLDRGLAAHGPGQTGHRIGDVEQPGVRTHLDHVLCDPDQHRHVSQRAVDPTRAHRVPHRLADSIPRRHVEVDLHRIEPAGRDGHDDEVGTGECPALVGGGGEGDSRSHLLGQPAPERFHLLERRGVDVLEHHVRPVEGLGAQQVGQELRRPLVAAASDDGDLHIAQRPRRARSSPSAMTLTLSSRSPQHRCRSPGDSKRELMPSGSDPAVCLAPRPAPRR